jgi:hypothetical protein
MRIPVALSDSLTVGTYDFTFSNVADFSAIPKLVLPLDFSVLGKHVSIIETIPDVSNKEFHLVVTLWENPIPVAAIALGLIVILALSLTFMTLTKVEKIVDSPAADIGIVAVAIAIIAGVFHFSGLKL